jgi:hypothetical protein
VKLDVVEGVSFRLLPCPSQHSFGYVDPNNAAMARIHGKRKSSPHTDFEDLFIGLYIEIPNGRFTPFMKHFPKHFVVEPRVVRVDTLNLVGIHASSRLETIDSLKTLTLQG